LAKAVEQLLVPDPQLSMTLSSELHDALASYSIEAQNLIRLIAQTELHQNKVASDPFLDPRAKQHVIKQWGVFHGQAVQVQLALSHDSSAYGSLLALVPKPASSGVGLYAQPRATAGDDTLNLTPLMASWFKCTRPRLLLLSVDELTRMAGTLSSDLAQWARQPDGQVEHATAVRGAMQMVQHLITRRDRHHQSGAFNEGGGFGGVGGGGGGGGGDVATAMEEAEAVAVAEAAVAAHPTDLPAAQTKVPEMGTVQEPATAEAEVAAVAAVAAAAATAAAMTTTSPALTARPRTSSTA
jgi:hypothetical protein